MGIWGLFNLMELVQIQPRMLVKKLSLVLNCYSVWLLKGYMNKA